jgi:Zn-dependent protease with chaperone function
MTHAHGGLLVVLVALFMGAAAGNLLVLMAGQLLSQRRLSRLPPARLTRLAAVGLSLPALLGAAAVVAVVSVPALALVFPRLDHCTGHGGALHVCFTHGTLAWGSPLEAAGAIFLLVLLALALGREVHRLLRARRAVFELLAGLPRRPVTWTDDELPYAFSVGIFRPRIIMSAGLREVLSPRQVRAALAHERAHLRHLDALVRVLTRVASFLLLAPMKSALTELLVLGQEKRADAEAATTVGSAALVAETLLTMCRLGPIAGHPPMLAPSLSADALEARIEALCRAPVTDRVTPWLMTAVAALMLSVLGAHGQVHEAAESVASGLLSTPVHSHDVDAAGAGYHHSFE